MARTADVVIMMLDATKGEVQRSAVGAGQADSLGRPCGGNRTLATARVSLSSWWVVPGVLGPLPRGSSGRTVHGYTQCRRPGAASPRGLCLEDGAVPCHPGSGSCLQGPGCPVAAQSLPGARPHTAEPGSRPGLRLRAQQANLHPGRTPADLPSDRPEGLGLLLSTFGCWEGTFGGWWRVREGRLWRVGAARPAPGTCEGHGGSTRSLLEKELGSVGIRLNKHKPNIYFKVRPRPLSLGEGVGPAAARGARGAGCSCRHQHHPSLAPPAQERRRHLLQLDGHADAVLREAGAADLARV